MVETFIIDWPILAFFGFLFGGASSRIGVARALIAGLVPTGGLTASALLSYRHAPDWMWMYYRDPEEMEPVAKLMGPGYLAAFLLTFLGAVRMDRSSLRSASGLAVGAEAAAVAATWDRCHRIGTKEEWLNGTADELISLNPEGRARQIAAYAPLLVATFVAGAVLAWGGRAPASRR